MSNRALLLNVHVRGEPLCVPSLRCLWGSSRLADSAVNEECEGWCAGNGPGRAPRTSEDDPAHSLENTSFQETDLRRDPWKMDGAGRGLGGEVREWSWGRQGRGLREDTQTAGRAHWVWAPESDGWTTFLLRRFLWWETSEERRGWVSLEFLLSVPENETG